MLGFGSVLRPHHAFTLLVALLTLPVSACTLLPPKPPQALYELADSAARTLCGSDDRDVRNATTQLPASPPVYAVEVSCGAGPQRPTGEYPALLAEAFGVSVIAVRPISGFPGSPGGFSVSASPGSTSWSSAILSFPAAGDDTGPVLLVKGR